MNFDEANKVEHPVEKQWHYATLRQAGFEAVTKSATGLVRSYTYTHGDGREIKCVTGVHGDYWMDTKTGESGYWSNLADHVYKVAH